MALCARCRDATVRPGAGSRCRPCLVVLVRGFSASRRSHPMRVLRGRIADTAPPFLGAAPPHPGPGKPGPPAVTGGAPAPLFRDAEDGGHPPLGPFAVLHHSPQPGRPVGSRPAGLPSEAAR